MNRRPDAYRFALTGSSARKFKRGGVNLLAGRAINRRFLPLTGLEMAYDFELDDLLRFGCLPAVRSEPRHESPTDIMDAYVVNYVEQEIRQEAAVQNLEAFARFLQIAGIMNAEVINTAGIARDAGVARQTVQGYFGVLFDTGVVRGVSGRLREPLSDEERGRLLETLIFHELRAHINVAGCGGKLTYWRTPSGSEIDFVWTRGELPWASK